MSERWLTAREIAAEALPGLPATERAIQLRATRESWPFRDRQGRGGGREYPVSALPAPAREAFARRLLKTDAPPAPKPAKALPAPASLKGWQRATQDARCALLLQVDRLQVTAGLSRTAAAALLVDQAAAGELREDLAALIPAANARGGASGARLLSKRTVLRWLEARDQAGAVALAPREAAPERALVPGWAVPLLRLYSRPQKPSLAWCLEFLPAELADGMAPPSYDQAKRFLRAMSAIDRNRGRMGARALRNLKAYVVRDYEGLWPTAIYVADGHTFDAEVQHPIHGQPFRPEVTVVIDVATRVIAGWSIALSENTWSVADAMRHAFTRRGVPAIWYVDRGRGFNNAAMDDPATGFIPRLGVHKENSIAWNSQARGVVERVHQSCLVRAAKTLPTYMGAAMDAEARQTVFKLVRADIRNVGQSRQLMPWDQFRSFIAAEVEAYNNRRHSELGQSPADRWARLLAEQPDTVIERLTESEAAEAFRPVVERITRRGQVELFGNVYFLRELEHRHGETVRVGFETQDAGQVWVRDKADRLLGVARLEGNKVPFMPASTFAERAQRTRTQGRLQRLQRHVDEARAELGAPAQIEHRPAATIDPYFLAKTEAEEARLEAEAAVNPPPAPQDPNARPHFHDDVAWVAWVADHPDQAKPGEVEAVTAKLRRIDFRLLLESWDLDPDLLLQKLRKAA